MRHSAPARCRSRRAHFEQYEDRLVLSAVPGTEPPADNPSELVYRLPDTVDLTPTSYLNTYSSGNSPQLQYLRETYGLEGTGQTIAIIDSGIAYDHVAFGSGFGTGYQVVGGWDFTQERDGDPYDDGPAGFHGTHVAGIVASQDSTHPGVAPGVDIVALRVFNDQGIGYAAWLEEALQWVHDNRDAFRYPITTVNMSLGASWNGSSPPAWAMLEDELAQLTQDGIFIAAAAGNSFASYQTPGLAYPAASPYVVPVASVGASGALSGFSQRDARVLAVPGEYIVSAVPDYIFGVDGNVNDWAAASGTSMATPYLAGVSMLVREAMEFTGYASPTPNEIYSHLLETSDLIFDAVTAAYYHRVNVTRAIESLMPADDYGNSLDSPFDLGLLRDTRSVSGQLARLDDRDVFQCSVATSGLLSWQLTSDQAAKLTLLIDGAVAETSGDEGAVRVAAGQTLTLIVAADQQLANYDVNLALAADQSVVVEGHTIRVTGTAADDRFELRVADRFQLEVNGSVFSYARSSPWRFEFVGNGGRDQLTVVGSEGDEQAILRPNSAEVQGPGYEVTAVQMADIVVLAGGGSNNVARLFDSVGNDELVAGPTSAQMTGAGYSNQAVGFQSVQAQASDGADVARLYDSSGNDRFVARPQQATMAGSGFHNFAGAFDRVYAHATSGGIDIAQLYDSAGNDLVHCTPRVTTMQGADFYYEAHAFDRVHAYSMAGGSDTARLYDSAGNDVVYCTVSSTSMYGAGYFYEARAFESVVAYATAGGNDTAHLYDSAGDDVLWATPTATSMWGDSVSYKVWAFDQVYAYATSGGNDVAYMFDSRGDDRFEGRPSSSCMWGNGFYYRASQFERVHAGSYYGGHDIALLYAAEVSDVFERGAEATSLRGAAYWHTAYRFQQVNGFAADGRAAQTASPAAHSVPATSPLVSRAGTAARAAVAANSQPEPLRAIGSQAAGIAQRIAYSGVSDEGLLSATIARDDGSWSENWSSVRDEQAWATASAMPTFDTVAELAERMSASRSTDLATPRPADRCEQYLDALDQLFELLAEEEGSVQRATGERA